MRLGIASGLTKSFRPKRVYANVTINLMHLSMSSTQTFENEKKKKKLSWYEDANWHASCIHVRRNEQRSSSAQVD